MSANFRFHSLKFVTPAIVFVSALQAQAFEDPKAVAGQLIMSAVEGGMPVAPGSSAVVDVVKSGTSCNGENDCLPDAPSVTQARIKVIRREGNRVQFQINGQNVYFRDSLVQGMDDVSNSALPDSPGFSSSAANEDSNADEATAGVSTSQPHPRKGIDYKSALIKSQGIIVFLTGYRMASEVGTQSDTFTGKYLRKIGQAYKNDFRFNKWADGDNFFTNDVEHPLAGAVYGQIWCDADPKCKDLDFGFNKNYLVNGLIKPWGFSAMESAIFENGPVSETTFGAVGYSKARDKKGNIDHHGTYGMTDYVMTPAGVFMFKAATDAWHTFVVKPFDSKGIVGYKRELDTMAANGTLTAENIDKAEKRNLNYSWQHKVTSFVVHAVDYNKTAAAAIYGKNVFRAPTLPNAAK